MQHVALGAVWALVDIGIVGAGLRALAGVRMRLRLTAGSRRIYVLLGAGIVLLTVAALADVVWIGRHLVHVWAQLGAGRFAGTPPPGPDFEPLVLSGGALLAVAGAAGLLTRPPVDAEVEQELLSERLLEAQRIAGLGLWEWEVEDDRLWWSDETYRIFGLSREVFGGTYPGFLEAVAPEDRETVRRAVDAALHQDVPYRIRHRIVRPDGSTAWVSEQAQVLRDEHGRATRMVGTVLDVSEVTEAADRAARLWWVLEQTGKEVFVLDAQTWKFLDATRGATEKLGYDVGELRKLDLFDVFPDVARDGLEPQLDDLRSGARSRIRWSTSVRRRDGSTYPADVDVHVTMLDHTASLVMIATDVSEHHRLVNRLRRLAGKQERIREEERLALARDLHDALGQTLSVAAMDLTVWREESQAAWIPRIDTLLGLVRRALDQVRRIVENLRPGPLHELGLAAAIQWLCDEFTETSGLPCRVALPEEVEEPDLETGITLFRVAQEALTNVRRHASAGAVSVHLEVVPSAWRIVVEDDGGGALSDDLTNGYGLMGMRERISLLGGSLSVETRPGEGFRVTATVPRREPDGSPAPSGAEA